MARTSRGWWLETALALCDRGTLDGPAYWPDDLSASWARLHTTPEAEMTRYAAVIHLRTPSPDSYNPRNPLRTESAREAAAIDERILEIWSRHPRFHVVDASRRFTEKVSQAVDLSRDLLPPCER